MKIERLDIGDFGIFTNQTLDNVNSNLVVVGGLNRAGKTTLLQVLRYLGYGLPQDGSLPPARNDYQIQADCRLADKGRFNISLEGYGDPQINGLGATKQEENIYSATLDEYTYQQLFTISLDELQQTPGNNQEQKKLQSILLGAGLGDILNIQNISKELTKEAKRIGGKNGNCDVYQFSGPQQKIKEGLELKEAANRELDEYQQIQTKLAATENKIESQTAKIKQYEAQVTVLDVVKSNFSDWEQKKKLDFRLAEYEEEELESEYTNLVLNKAKELQANYKEAEKEYREQLAKFKRKVMTTQVQAAKDKLLAHKSQLEQFTAELSGLQERIKQLRERVSRNKNKQQQIEEEIKQQNESWTDFDSVLEINFDQIAEDKLNQTINKQKKLTSLLKEREDKYQELNNKKTYIQNQLGELENLDLTSEINKYYLIAGSCLSLGLVLFLLGLWLPAAIISLVGVIGGGINFFITHILENNSVTQQQNLRLDLNEINSQLAAEEKKITELRTELAPLEKKIDGYRESLKLPPEASVELVKDSFRQVRTIKQKIIDWQTEEQKINKHRQQVKQELKQLQELIRGIFTYLEGRTIDWPPEEVIANSEQLFSLLKQTKEYLRAAEKLDSKGLYKQELEKKIEDFLPAGWQCDELREGLEQFINWCKKYETYHQLTEEKEKLEMNVLASLKTERVKEAFKTLGAIEKIEVTRKELLAAFDSYFKQYTSREDIEYQYKQASKQLKTLTEELADLQKQQQSLVDKQDELATSDRLNQARQKIRQGRKELKPLAKEFAVKRAASFILDEVRDRFIDRVQDELLAPASEMMNQMTEGEYQKILPQEDLTKVDFKLQLATEEVDTVEELSRGTKEQLFLAVRLSRIKEIKPALPVILDDSLVNFDAYHLAQVVELLGKLAQTHQVFILTCHANLIAHLAKQVAADIQYWKLDQGKINLSSREELIEYLSFI